MRSRDKTELQALHGEACGQRGPALVPWFKQCDMQEGEAEVAQHLRGLGCPPLQVALPWILTAFAGHLAPLEVLLLWDRILGFDSLLPLPLLAVAILAFRRQVSCYLCTACWESNISSVTFAGS